MILGCSALTGNNRRNRVPETEIKIILLLIIFIYFYFSFLPYFSNELLLLFLFVENFILHL